MRKIVPRPPSSPAKLAPLAASAAVPLSVEMRGGGGRPILAAAGAMVRAREPEHFVFVGFS
ncbi:hypothetical protein E2562_021123 [Oryza meyeriana var. granulata]|uniref:Uncharacterized protein n=1 Tax=Oryza meyeriana var. granulata TaxID=110450 RepID=A0A6G1BMU8_9ORYZ|nr:hypothetical protein E2562_021123 [Oryza meyeriana var. granulata]